VRCERCATGEHRGQQNAANDHYRPELWLRVKNGWIDEVVWHLRAQRHSTDPAIGLSLDYRRDPTIMYCLTGVEIVPESFDVAGIADAITGLLADSRSECVG
jgi:hypothetical protein